MFDAKAFAKENGDLIDQVCDVFLKNGLEPRRGEQILLWCYGLSVGQRKGDLTPDLEVAATAFQLAVELGD